MEEHRIFSALYKNVYRRIEPSIIRRRRTIVAGGARGKVLEVGVGNGLNLSLCVKAEEVWGVEPDPSMLGKIGARMQASPAPVKLLQTEAEELPFEDNTFDTVVMTLVFCSVRDPARASREMFRVLKPGGELRFLEHVQSRGAVWAGVQAALTPVWSHIAAGCRLNRDSLRHFKEAGFQLEDLEYFLGGIFPVVMGTGRKDDNRRR